MKGISHIIRIRAVLPGALLAVAILVGACDFKLLESPEMPRWGVSITLPLINQNYPFSGVPNDSTIFEGDSLVLQIEFSDTLQRTSLDASYLFIEVSQSETISQSENAPDGNTFADTVNESITVVFALDSLLNVAGMPVSLPSPFPVPITMDTWNTLVNSVNLDQQVGPFPVFDTTAITNSISFIKRVRYVQLSSDPGLSEFTTTVVNNFPTAIESVSMELFSLGAAADTLLYRSHATTNLSSGDTFSRNSDLKSGKLGGSLSMVIAMALPLVTETVIIPADSTPKITITIGLGVGAGAIDSVAVTTANTPLNLDVTPPPMQLPSDVQITRGRLESGMIPPVNEITLSGLRNRLPFDIDLEIIFPNFSSDSLGSDSLQFGLYTLTNGKADTSDTKDLGNYWFLDPGGGTISQFEIIVNAAILEKDVMIPLDGLPLGDFQATFSVGDLQFALIEGLFNVSFETVPTTIDKIPTGFTGFLFDRIRLELRLFNEIALPVNLALNLRGLNARGDTVEVPIVAKLNYPITGGLAGSPATTVIVLDENGASTYWLAAGDSLISEAFWDTSVANEDQSIVDVINMAPDTIEVGGVAVIDGKGAIVADAELWGTFELEAPFAFIIPYTITFLPADATPVAPMDSSVREQIRTALLSASLTSIVTSYFPIAGNIDMLVSDSTLFPLAFDELDQLTAGIPETVYTTYDTIIYRSLTDALEADSIFGISHIVYYPESSSAGQATARSGIRATRVEFFATGNDSVPAFWVGRLFDMEIPAAGVDDIWGHVDPDRPGDTTQVIALDAERVNWLTSDETVYVKPLISFYKTDGARTVQSTNSIDFAAYITFEMSSDILVPPKDPDTTQVTAGSIASYSVAVDSIISIGLDNVFSHLDGQTPLKDMELDAVSNHTGVASVDVAPDTSDADKRRVYITGKGVGAAKITVTADDDPQDRADPVAVSFYVTVYQDTSSGSPSGPGLNSVPMSPARDERRESILRSTTWLPEGRR
ncbi:MAG: hypothetical protein IID13_03870 [Candidatus Marinimicrobia bacterium]|nr:hypothetical protein [Candidatus Neomarinimicrobiota bacterium]